MYCADGEVVELLVEALTHSSLLHLPVLIGVHSHQSHRAEEYLQSDNGLFVTHEKFFCHELRSWAHLEYGIPPEREASIVFGFSNGGAFAVAAALRNPDQFSAAFAFSVPPLPQLPSIPAPGAAKPSIYLATGNQGAEKSIRKNVLRIARWLRDNELPLTLSERRAGHTMDFWAAEFVVALEWFGQISTPRC